MNYVQTIDSLRKILAGVGSTAPVTIDCETTGLNHRTAGVRLIQLGIGPAPTEAIIIDLYKTGKGVLPVLAEFLNGRDIYGHNLTFDLTFLFQAGCRFDAVLYDTYIAGQVLTAGMFPPPALDLGSMAQKYLNVTLPKDLQKADWSGGLTPEMLAYAERDVLHIVALWQALRSKMIMARVEKIVRLECDIGPAMADMRVHGVEVNRVAWENAAIQYGLRKDELFNELDRLAPQSPHCLPNMNDWKYSSPESIKALYSMWGIQLLSTDKLAMLSIDHGTNTQAEEFTAAFQEWKSCATLVNNFGAAWLEQLSGTRVYPEWKQLGTRTGRMSCAKPNLTQIPRNAAYRSCFVASPGHVLIGADYSQIELRVAAIIAPDMNMRAIYARGEDIHTLVASRITGNPHPTKLQRTLAKNINFGYLYGMGPETYMAQMLRNYRIRVSKEDAKAYQKEWFSMFPGIDRWHKTQNTTTTVRTLGGRLRYNVTNRQEKLNTPIQGTGGDGLKLALARLYREKKVQLVITCHDELLVEVPAADPETLDEYKRYVSRVMEEEMSILLQHKIPIEAEAKIMTSWADKD